jgi:hypothetical protein
MDQDPVFLKTTDHGVIRAWIEEHDGTPIEKETSDGERIIDLAFGDEASSGISKLSWEEFLDHLDINQLVFTYTDDLAAEEIALAYRILTKEEAAEMFNDETELPDPSDLAEENLDNEYVEDAPAEEPYPDQ